MDEDRDCESLRNNNENSNDCANIGFDSTPRDGGGRSLDQSVLGNRRVTFTSSVGYSGQKRQAPTSLSTLNSSIASRASHPSRHAFQRQDLGSTQKRLRSTFEYASLPAHSATPSSFQPQAVCCEGIENSELQDFVDSSSAKVLKHLHGSVRVVRGKAFSHDCSMKEWLSPLSPQPKDWKRTNGQWICPSCNKLKHNFSQIMKKLDQQLQSEYIQTTLTTSTPLPPLPSTSVLKEFVKSYLQHRLRYTQYGDERRPDIVAEFQSNHNVKEAMSLLKLREDSCIEVKAGANERFVVDCCNGQGCQEILVRQARGQNLSCCLQCNKKNVNNERHEKLKSCIAMLESDLIARLISVLLTKTNARRDYKSERLSCCLTKVSERFTGGEPVSTLKRHIIINLPPPSSLPHPLFTNY